MVYVQFLVGLNHNHKREKNCKHPGEDPVEEWTHHLEGAGISPPLGIKGFGAAWEGRIKQLQLSLIREFVFWKGNWMGIWAWDGGKGTTSGRDSGKRRLQPQGNTLAEVFRQQEKPQRLQLKNWRGRQRSLQDLQSFMKLGLILDQRLSV